MHFCFTPIFISKKPDPNQPNANKGKNMAKSYFLNCAHIISSTYLVVLVRRDRNERCFGEHMSAKGGVFGAKPVIFIRLNDVDPRLVFMHRVQNDLKRKKWDKTCYNSFQKSCMQRFNPTQKNVYICTKFSIP